MIEEATEVRRRVPIVCEAAEGEQAPDEQRLVDLRDRGRSASAVELVGALAENYRVFNRHFHRIKSQCARIILIEAGSRMIPNDVGSHREIQHGNSSGSGFELMLNTVVTSVDDTGVKQHARMSRDLHGDLGRRRRRVAAWGAIDKAEIRKGLLGAFRLAYVEKYVKQVDY
jgi:NADH dehydrogenase FAD-containing subunit